MDAHSIRGVLVEEFIANGKTAQEISEQYAVPLNLIVDYILAYQENTPVTFNLVPDYSANTFHEFLENQAANYLLKILNSSSSITQAAKKAGISRTYLHKKINGYKLYNRFGIADKHPNTGGEKVDVGIKGNGRKNRGSSTV
jgi:hypothetical protein